MACMQHDTMPRVRRWIVVKVFFFTPDSERGDFAISELGNVPLIWCQRNWQMCQGCGDYYSHLALVTTHFDEPLHNLELSSGFV